MGLKRGETILVYFDPVVGSEQGKIRPAVIIQNNVGNQYSPTTIVAPITSKALARALFRVHLEVKDGSLKKESIILLNQIRVVDKKRIKKRIGMLDPYTMQKVDDAIKISLGLN